MGFNSVFKGLIYSYSFTRWFICKTCTWTDELGLYFEINFGTFSQCLQNL